MQKPDPELIDDDNPEWTDADFAHARPAREVLPEIFPPALAAEMLKPKRRGTQKSPTKVPTTIRFDADILQALRATGRGWQTRVNDMVREWVASHP
ncbi:MAG: BrnA antitoxin family protein [Methylobacillus sp.]|jgi:uncharacterized protein (DUF4415 family)|nr:BrnA antitoxin family protein [Methylobacillus sp.]